MTVSPGGIRESSYDMRRSMIVGHIECDKSVKFRFRDWALAWGYKNTCAPCNLLGKNEYDVFKLYHVRYQNNFQTAVKHELDAVTYFSVISFIAMIDFFYRVLIFTCEISTGSKCEQNFEGSWFEKHKKFNDWRFDAYSTTISWLFL